MAYAKKRHLSYGEGLEPVEQEGPKIWSECSKWTSNYVDDLDGEPITCAICKRTRRYKRMLAAKETVHSA